MNDEFERESAEDFLARLSAKANSLFGPEMEPTATDAVRHDRFDEHDWQGLQGAVPNIGKAIQRLSLDFGRVPALYQDLYNGLHLTRPEMRVPEEMDPRYLPNHAIVDAFQDTPGWQNVRPGTVGDSYGTAMALIGLEPVVREALEEMREAQERAEELAKALEEAANARSQLQDQMDQVAGAHPMQMPLPPEIEEQLNQLMQQAQQAQQNAQQGQQEAEAKAQTAAAGMRQAAKDQLNKTAEELDEEEALFRAFGVDDGELKKMSFEERYQKAKMLRGSRLAEFSKLIGQFKMLQQAESRRKLEHVPDEVTGVQLGDDLTRLTPQELENMAAPETEDDFWLRYTEKTLINYKLTGTEKVGKGPIICVVDESGSMDRADVMNGTREAWSKALVLALLDQARGQGRDFHYIGFSSAGQMWHKGFEEGQGTLEQIVEITEHFFCGGTHYEKPLREAADIVKRAHAATGKPKPDIVFMTDDEYGGMPTTFLDEWHAVRKLTQMRVFGIAIGCSYSGAMEQVSDDVRAITELVSDPRTVSDLFRLI